MSGKPYRVWDLPVRLFHWSLVILIAISIYTGENGGFNEMDYHMLSGYAVLAIILFRIIWGFVGSRHARFSDFLKPTKVAAYIRTLFSREKDETNPGHNPLGGLSVVAILLVLLIQASTGLFANDDIFLEGPLTHLVEDEMSDDLTTVHYYASRVLYGLIFLHLAAIIYHQFIRKDGLLLPMITGKLNTQSDQDDKAKPLKETAIAGLVMAVCAGFVYYLINEV